MRYRDAKLLCEGDEVVRKDDKTSFIVKEVEVFGQYKKVKLKCLAKDLPDTGYVYLFHEELV
jgi:hypothetical protein